MYDRDSQFGFADLERRMNAQIDVLRTDLENANATIDSLTNRVSGLSNLSYSEITNILDNSFPEWSKAAYTGTGVSPSTVSDDNREAYNWYRQPSADTELVANSTNALKASGHSTFAANEDVNGEIPRWKLPEGYIEMGGVSGSYDLLYPLPNDLVYPGLVFYIQFEAMLRSGTLPDIQFFAEFWDNTAGQRKIIEGGAFTITGEIFGTPGTRSVEYKVLARTDSGEEALSNTLAFANAPNTFSQNNHPRINFRGAPGYIEFEIYRKEVSGSMFVLQYIVRNSIEGTYFDVGNSPIRDVSGFPSASTTPKAYAKTRTFRPGSSDFVRHSLTIQVPTTYDSSLTGAGMQWLRLGLTGNTATDRQVWLRKFGLSLGEGSWSRSSYDNQVNAHSTRTATASSAPSGGSGGGVDDPPPFGSGGHCVLMESLVSVLENGEIKQITLRELQKRCLEETIFCYSAGVIGGRVRAVRKAYASRVLKITTSSSSVTCTLDHPFILNQTDINGTPASKLKKGDFIWFYNGNLKKEEILGIEEQFGDFEIGIPSLEGSHICILNGFVSHNKAAFDPNDL